MAFVPVPIKKEKEYVEEQPVDNAVYEENVSNLKNSTDSLFNQPQDSVENQSDEDMADAEQPLADAEHEAAVKDLHDSANSLLVAAVPVVASESSEENAEAEAETEIVPSATEASPAEESAEPVEESTEPVEEKAEPVRVEEPRIFSTPRIVLRHVAPAATSGTAKPKPVINIISMDTSAPEESVEDVQNAPESEPVYEAPAVEEAQNEYVNDEVAEQPVAEEPKPSVTNEPVRVVLRSSSKARVETPVIIDEDDEEELQSPETSEAVEEA